MSFRDMGSIVEIDRIMRKSSERALGRLMEQDLATLERLSPSFRVEFGQAFNRAMNGLDRGIEDLYELIVAWHDCEERFHYGD
jgi:hypothetical protein